MKLKFQPEENQAEGKQLTG